MADTEARADKPLVFVAFDTEARGMSPMRHGMNAIGVCVTDENGLVINKRFWALKPLPGQDFEQCCLDEFWSKPEMREIRERIDREAIEPGEAIAGFYNLLADLGKWNRVVLVGDAPYFDVPMITYYLDYFGYPPLHYMPEYGIIREPAAQVTFERSQKSGTKTFRPKFSPVTDALAYANGLVRACIACTGEKLNKEALDELINFVPNGVVHDHNPANDAEYIAQLFFAACKSSCNRHE
jgi:hypothetical protein